MLKRVIGYFEGRRTLEASGSGWERAANLMAREGIRFEGAVPKGEGMRFEVRERDAERAGEIIRGLGLTVKMGGRRGAVRDIKRHRRHFGLFAGLAAAAALLLLSNTVILRFNVDGNSTVSEERILAALRREGIGIGTSCRDISIRWLKPRVILHLPEVSWISVNRKGSTANVSVDERVEAPAVRDEGLITDVKAAKTGIVQRVDVYAGTPLVKKGDTVMAGDPLISAKMDSPFAGLWYVNARGAVFCDTWYRAQVKIPLNVSKKIYTGRERREYALLIGSKRINLSFNTGISHMLCDKIEENDLLPGFLEYAFPFSVQKTVYREYETGECAVSTALAEQAAKESLSAALDDWLSPGGEVISRSFETENIGGVLTVTLSAGCQEDIARR